VVQALDILICEPSNHTMLPTARTLTRLESGEHVETICGMYSHIFSLEYGYLYFFWFVSLIMSLVYIDSYLGLWINKVHINLAESPRTLHGTSSSSEHIASNTCGTRDKNLQRMNHDKAWWDKLTPEQREEMNARRRAVRKNKTNEERNARQRRAGQNLTPNERQVMRAQRNTWLAAKRNTPCAESIAMPRPGAYLFWITVL
jgi:hypothetical protein